MMSGNSDHALIANDDHFAGWGPFGVSTRLLLPVISPKPKHRMSRRFGWQCD